VREPIVKSEESFLETMGMMEKGKGGAQTL
jgi:hypothetical protein